MLPAAVQATVNGLLVQLAALPAAVEAGHGAATIKALEAQDKTLLPLLAFPNPGCNSHFERE